MQCQWKREQAGTLALRFFFSFRKSQSSPPAGLFAGDCLKGNGSVCRTDSPASSATSSASAASAASNSIGLERLRGPGAILYSERLGDVFVNARRRLGCIVVRLVEVQGVRIGDDLQLRSMQLGFVEFQRQLRPARRRLEPG